MSYPKIKVTPPGPKAQKIVDRDHSLISPSFGRAYPLVVKSGDGCIITDVDGNEYIDMNAGLAVASVGHRHPRVTQAIKEQVDRFIHYSYTDFYYENYVDLGETLHDLLPGSFKKKFYYGNSGAEAVEAFRELGRSPGIIVVVLPVTLRDGPADNLLLRAQSAGSRADFVVLAPGDRPEDRAALLAEGADEVLDELPDPDRLVGKLGLLRDRRRLIDDLDLVVRDDVRRTGHPVVAVGGDAPDVDLDAAAVEKQLQRQASPHAVAVRLDGPGQQDAVTGLQRVEKALGRF